MLLTGAAGLLPVRTVAQQDKKGTLSAGFAEADITPDPAKKTVYLAGFGQNRKATKVHDPLKARAVVFKDGTKKIALVSVDVVGLFLETVAEVRKDLPGFDYVLVSSTHNHEGPDTLGLWGPHPFQSGIDPEYMTLVRQRIADAVHQADKECRAVTAQIGMAEAPELLHDARKPEVKHATLVALLLKDVQGKAAGVVVQWNCHPETLGSKNTEISADFVGATVGHLRQHFECPVVYLTGTVGGLMTSMHVPVADEKGNPLQDGTFAKTERYGQLIGQLAEKALDKSKPVALAPLNFAAGPVYLPIDNTHYVFGWQIGVLKRKALAWKGSATEAGSEVKKIDPKERVCLESELALLRCGELDIACIPGEIYPELVLGRVQDPPDPGADFPDAPIEPAIYQQMHGPYRMLIGLANDELGYIIPKRQWDVKPPFCYGLQQAQYGEGNSLGPETAPLLCGRFQQLAKGLKKANKNED
jgi:hypothetical protein